MSKKPVKQNLQKPESTKDSGKIFFYGFLTALSVALILICLENKFVQDDAFISFRYVQNFAEGKGLVFNIGEKVEGYTNLLWVLILSVFAFLKMNIQTVSQFLSIVFGVMILFITYFISNLIEINSPDFNQKKSKAAASGADANYFNLIPSVLLVFTASFIFWTVSGMETTMFIFFCLVGIYYYIKSKNSNSIDYRFSVFIFLATLTRPEGMYFFGLILIHYVFFNFKQRKSDFLKNLFSKENIKTYLVYVIPLLLYFAVRYSYYGYMFPNTYYAKTGFSSAYLNSGIEYFTKFLTSYLIYGLILILPLYLFKNKDTLFETSLFYFLIVCFILYVISVGGDVLKQGRFFLPVLPLIYILFAKFLTQLYYILKGKTAGGFAFPSIIVITAVVCIFYYTSQKENLEKDIQSENGLVDKMKSAGIWFKSKQNELGKPMTVAATTIGAVSYFAGHEVNVIDLLGLTDEEIAHNPKLIPEISEQSIGWKERNYNADYVMSRKPEYIYFSTGLKPSAYAERALFTTEDFNKYYYPYYSLDKNTGSSMEVFKRKSEDEVKDQSWDFPGNPNYKITFVNMFNQAMNSSRSKSRIQIALDEFRQSAETGPKNFGMPYQYMGDIYLQLGNKDKAIESYKKAVDINDYSILSHYQLYQLYSELKDSANASASLRKIQKYDPEILK